LRRYKAKCVKTRCLQEWVGHLEPKFQGEGVVPGEYFFGLYKTRHILLSNSANCTVLRAVVLTQYRRVTDRQTDGQTDGIVVASTALAMRAVKMVHTMLSYLCLSCLSVLSVMLDYCGQIVGWIKCMRTQRPLLKNGSRTPLPKKIRPMSIVAKCLDGSRCHLVRR